MSAEGESFWDKAWERAKAERPSLPSRPKSWPSFWFTIITIALMAMIWFPVRLLSEIFKTVNLNPKQDQKSEMQALFREAYDKSRDLPSPRSFATSILDHAVVPDALKPYFTSALAELYQQNVMLEPLPIPLGGDDLIAIRWRDQTRKAIATYSPSHLVVVRQECLASVESACLLLPPLIGSGEVTSPLASLTNAGRFIEALVKPLSKDHFPAFAETYQQNVNEISNVPKGRQTKPIKLVEPHHLDDPSPFLKDTPFAGLLNIPLPTDLPEDLRNSHHWIVAGTGAGKTNALQYFLKTDLLACVRGEASLVVLDSQHQLIDQLWSLKLFAQGQPLDGKLCLLDAADIEFPIAINLFDMKLDELNTRSPLEREKLLNSAIEMYEFIIGSLLQAEMTSRQSTLFRFVLRMLFAIPQATIHTFQDILVNGVRDYQSAIATLDETTQKFFASDFNGAQFKQTKEQVIARLWAVLGNQTFSRMFSAPRSKIDFFKEINTPGKVILINAEKGLLKEEGTELFGRFFLGLINQAAAQRSSLAASQRLPCRVYIDECHNYIKNDPKIQVILAEARQQNIGLILSHQFLGQLEPPVLRSLGANTSIKMAARLEGADRSALARDMNCTPDFISDQSVGSFATYLRGITANAIAMKFPLNALSQFERMSATERSQVRDLNRELYANPVAATGAWHSRSEQVRPRDEPKPSSGRRDPDA